MYQNWYILQALLFKFSVEFNLLFNLSSLLDIWTQWNVSIVFLTSIYLHYFIYHHPIAGLVEPIFWKLDLHFMLSSLFSQNILHFLLSSTKISIDDKEKKQGNFFAFLSFWSNNNALNMGKNFGSYCLENVHLTMNYLHHHCLFSFVARLVLLLCNLFSNFSDFNLKIVALVKFIF